MVAESVLVKHQLLILNRSRKRSPNLRPFDRVVAGLCALFMSPGRLIRSAIVVKPSTLLSLHRALVQRKYRRLFSSNGPTKPGPKGPSQEVIAAVVDMKQRNPIWGSPRIAQQITLAFGIPINKDVVRRILAARYRPKPDAAGPSWLTVLGHAKDSLWSLDLFRCESAVLHTHWVLVVMDHCTRRIVGFGVHRGVVDGVALCHMFNRAIGRQPAPTCLRGTNLPESYIVAVVRFRNGHPSHRPEVFADGFIGEGAVNLPADADHRPMALAEGHDGSLYITDDAGGRIWRVLHASRRPQR